MRNRAASISNHLALGIALLAMLLSLYQNIPQVHAQLPSSSIKNGSGAPSGGCVSGSLYIDSGTGNLWPCQGSVWIGPIQPSTVGFSSGETVLITSGSCPAGFAQVTTLNGAVPYGTLAANGDIGGTGGSNTITPTVASLTAAAQTFAGSAATTSAVSAGTPAGTNGTVSFTPAGTNNAPAISWPAGVPTFSGSAGTVPAQTFTGTPFSSVINHTHTVTVTYDVQGGTSASTTGTHVMTSTATGGSARAPTSGDVVSATTANPSGGVSSITPAGTNSTAAFTPAGTIAWPAGVPTQAAPTFSGSAGTVPAQTFTGSALGTHTHTLTATGTNSASAVTGTLNSFDNRQAFVKVIFCQKS